MAKQAKHSSWERATLSNWDVIIIGAGAAGLMAAASAAGRGRQVLLLEKNRKLGVKILMSGGTRCNITHDCSIRDVVVEFGRQGKFLHSALSALPPKQVIEKIEAQGVPAKIESNGKVFPVSNRAIDVRDALVRLATQSGATVFTERPVESIEKTESGFRVCSDQASLECCSLIITTGGQSYPGCGTTGDGYEWARQFGHRVGELVPALVPVLSTCTWANAIKGVTIEDTVVEVWQPDLSVDVNSDLSKSDLKKRKSRCLIRREGSFLFTHWGFSGPVVLDVSREIALHPERKRLELVVDFLPSQSLDRFYDFLLSKKSSSGKQIVGNLLGDLFPKRLADSLLAAAGVDLQMRNAEMSKRELSLIVSQVKRCRFPISGTLGFEKAEVTSGGVSLNEIDSSTMQSKKTSGLYFAGEVLDLDGPIGGFNFQSAFSTGWLAGMSA